MATLRSPEGLRIYKEFLSSHQTEGCVLCQKEPLRQFGFWKFIKNDFPYDAIAKRHDMLVPFRHATESELTEDEHREFLKLKETVLSDEYDFLIEPTLAGKSIPEHFHLHLIVSKG